VSYPLTPGCLLQQVTHNDAMAMIHELTGATVTTHGNEVPPGEPAPPGERKLFLMIEGPTDLSVKRARQEIKKILEETTE
jgi:ATP-dependent RNA helicase DDX46/PRP5